MGVRSRPTFPSRYVCASPNSYYSEVVPRMNLPNALTIARIFFVPLLVAALVEENVSVQIFGVVITNEWLALAIFLIAAVTDLLDGYLARKWGQVTTIGTLLEDRKSTRLN